MEKSKLKNYLGHRGHIVPLLETKMLKIKVMTWC